jgi:hypothetical protein
MKRSTNIAPLSLSTSYLIGSAFIGISMITLNSSGRAAPGVTLCRLMAGVGSRGTFDVKPPEGDTRARGSGPRRTLPRHPLTFAGLPNGVRSVTPAGRFRQ